MITCSRSTYFRLAVATTAGLMAASAPAAAQSPGDYDFTAVTKPEPAAKPVKKEAAKPAAAKTVETKPSSTAAKAQGRAPVGATAKGPDGKPLETGAIAPAAPPVKSTKFADWSLDCIQLEGKQRCGLRQTIADGQGRRIAQIMARHSGKSPYLEITVPLGISIPFGVALMMSDTSKIVAQLADCAADGCRAVAPLDDKALGEIKAAKALAIVFQDSKTGKVLKVNGSANGFADGVGKVASAK
jgi:invasion protein IalB